MTDPIADKLTRIRNATIARHTRVDIPASTLKLEIAKILELEGYIQSFKTVETPDGDGKSAVQKTIRVQLKYGPRGERVITGGRADGARRPRYRHPDHLARRHDRPRGPSSGRRRRSALQRVVS